MIPRAYVTGCDQHSEWMLPWFLENFKKHSSLPLIFADFGVSPKLMPLIEDSFSGIMYMSQPQMYNLSWFKKPEAMLNAQAKRVVWIDTDCEVLSNPDEIFDLIEPNKLLMAEDRPWTRRMGEKWHNSGVVGSMPGTCKTLYHWAMECKIAASPFGTVRGDQEVLHSMVRHSPEVRAINIKDLPNEYNWLRIQLLDGEDSPNKKIMHWTGAKGKDEIRRQIRERGTSHW